MRRREGFLEAAGHRLECRTLGEPSAKEPTLVLLHEGLGSVSLWRDFPEALAERTAFPVFLYSRAGYGRSSAAELPRPVTFMHEEALDVLPAVLDAGGIERSILVGHSDGASIALIHAGGAENGRSEALVLLAPHVFVEEVTVRSIRRLAESFSESRLRERLARHHGEMVDETVRGWADVWLEPSFRRWNIEELLPRVHIPVLLLQGEEDEYGTVGQIEAIERGVRGPVERLLLAGCGHAPWRDCREETLERIVRFLEDHVNGVE